MRGRITTAAVECLQPGEVLWDNQVTGFGIRRQSLSAVYVVKFRIGNLQQFVTIGRHGSGWNPETARVRAEELLKVAGQSERRSNSATTKKASKNSGPTFFDMSQRYLKEYSQPRKRETSYKGDCHNLARHVWPIIGDKLLADITRQDLSDLHIRMNGVPVAANRSLNLISHIFTMAEKWGIRTIGSNPCRGLDRYKERPRDRFLNSVELARLGLVLNLASKPDAGVNWNSCLPARQRIRVTAEDWRSISCIRLLLFTGARLGEILSLRWDYLNWDRDLPAFPTAKLAQKISH